MPVNPDRELFYEGKLQQLVKDNKVERFAFLFSDCLVFAKLAKKRRSTGASLKGGSMSPKTDAKAMIMYKVSHVIMLNKQMKFEAKGDLAFSVNVDGSQNFFAAVSKEERKGWEDRITQALARLPALKMKRQSTGSKSSIHQ